jgi:hypothetical protein
MYIKMGQNMFKKISRFKKLALSLIVFSVLFNGSAENLLKVKENKCMHLKVKKNEAEK